MQRRTNSRHYNNEEVEDDDMYASGSEGSEGYSDEPEDSTPPPPPPRSSGRRRDQRPQPQQTQSAPDASVTFFSGASGFEINGGNFTSIGGAVFNTASPYSAPTTPSRRTSAPRRKTEFFPNAQQFKINGGAFTAVNGDMHSPIHINVGPSPGYSPRAPPASRTQYPYGTPPNRGYPQDNAGPSSHKEARERRRRQREDDTSSQTQDEPISSNQSYSKSSSAQRPPFPTPQFADDRSEPAYPRPSEHAQPSQYPLPSPRIRPPVMRNMDPRDQASSSSANCAPPIPVPSASGTLSTESTSPSSPFSPAMPTSVSAPPSFPRYNNTMVAEYAMDIEELPEVIRGPAGNRDNVAPQPSGSNIPANSSNAPQSSNPPPNKTGKLWSFGKKSGKDKEKK